MSMSLFLAGIDNLNYLVEADSVERAAEQYAEGVGLSVGRSIEVEVRPALGGDSTTVFVANGGSIFGSTDGFVWWPNMVVTGLKVFVEATDDSPRPD